MQNYCQEADNVFETKLFFMDRLIVVLHINSI